MILTQKITDDYKCIGSKVMQGMAQHDSKRPYWISGNGIIAAYECLRTVWVDGGSIHKACRQHGLSRPTYYANETRFIRYGLPGLFPLFKNGHGQTDDLEQLVLLIKKSRPHLSQTAIFRISQAVPQTSTTTSQALISAILESHGYHPSHLDSDVAFWARIQRTIDELQRLLQTPVMDRGQRRGADVFFNGQDLHQRRLEALRELFFDPGAKLIDTCARHHLPVSNYYRLADEYRLYGPWAVIPAPLPGREGLAVDKQLQIILEKLKYPGRTPQQMADHLPFACSRFAVNRLYRRWGLTDKDRLPIALDQYMAPAPPTTEGFHPRQAACHLWSEDALLATRRPSRHFELLCGKMQRRAFHICDPGPLLLAPFVNALGIVQAFESYGPPQQRGTELTNIALLNIFRIIGGYSSISHLADNRDRSVAFASGVGMFGSTSKFYDDSLHFKFDQIHALRCDLVARAKELGLIEGTEIGFDFHFKPFFGHHSAEKGIGKGPDKAGNLVPGFRPHLAWDLTTNAIISLAYYQGATRSPKIIRRFCEQNIFPVLDPLAIKELYMDSEYTKEGDLSYFKQVSCPNGDVYICLRQNKQIKKLIKPALEQQEGWQVHDEADEWNMIETVLPHTGLPFKIVILRDRLKKDNIRCFGSTRPDIGAKELLKKYRHRWTVENGIKDLVKSYFLDQMLGQDPEKIEFDFYCIMVARLAFEYFLKALGDRYLTKPDGNKYTLATMRNLLLEKRNCTIEQDAHGNFVLTFLEAQPNDLEIRTQKMLQEWKKDEKNKVLWWNNRSILLKTKSQYQN